MTGDLLTQTNDLDIPIEPDAEVELEIEPELEPEPEPDAAPPPSDASAAIEPSRGLVEVLPADFRLPALIKYIPNPALRIAADQAGTYALGLTVDGPEGLQRADLALSAVRASLKAIDNDFEEPTAIANALHKRLTSMRGEWQELGKQAIATVGSRIYTEQKRLDGIAQEARRKAQAVADQQAREAAQREAAAAEQAQAPAPVVQELKRQAVTATAPPVATPAAAHVLRGSSTVTTWKARLIGTPGADEPNPKMAELTAPQRVEVLKLFKAIIDGSAPMVLFELNWSVINARAKAEKSTLSIPGLEAFEEGSLRAKGQRSK